MKAEELSVRIELENSEEIKATLDEINQKIQNMNKAAVVLNETLGCAFKKQSSKAQWIGQNKREDMYSGYKCSRCGYLSSGGALGYSYKCGFNYCPMCGAVMSEEGENT